MNRFWHIIKRTWWIFLTFFIVSTIVVITIDKSITRDKESETLFIFVATESMDHEGFYEYVNEIKDPYLKKVTYRYVKNTAPDFETIYNTTLLSWCDLVILPESKILESKIDYFIKIDPVKAQNYFGTQTYYSSPDRIYGIKIYDHINKTGKLDDYLNYGDTEDYYVFLRANSLHMGDLNNSAYYGGINFLRTIYEVANI